MTDTGAGVLLALLAPVLFIFLAATVKNHRVFQPRSPFCDQICYKRILNALEKSGTELVFQGRLLWVTLDRDQVVLFAREFTATSSEDIDDQKFKSKERAFRFAVILAKKIELRRRMRSSCSASSPRSPQ
jgi:hypothetical protein